MNRKMWIVLVGVLLVLAAGEECLAHVAQAEEMAQVAEVTQMADPAAGAMGTVEAAGVPDVDYGALEAENAELRMTVKKMWVFLVFMVVAVVYFMYDFMRGESRRFMDKCMAVAAGLKESMGAGKPADVGRKEDDPMRKAVDELFRAQFDTIDELCRTYYEFEGSGRDAEKIYKEVMAQIRKLTEDRKTMGALVANINRYHDNLMERFAEDYPKAGEADRNLFAYIVAGFSSQAISLFIKKDVTAVYRQKHRLKERVMKGEAARKEEYLKFF